MYDKLRLFLAACMLFFHAMNLSAQVSPFKFGIRLGGGTSVNPDMGKILVPEDYYSNYTFKDKWQAVASAGVFVLYHAPESLFGIEGGLGYWQKSSRLAYDDREGLHYTVTPRYHFLGATALFKVYPWRKGFHIAVGGRLGANLSGRGISYESNQEDGKFARYQFATVAETERLMKEKLTGRPDVSVGGGLGYEIGRHWGVDLRYFYGVTSTVKTETNTFNWVEHPTHSHSMELSVCYLFSL